MTSKRSDLPVEEDTTLDAAGTYTGDWIDTSSILEARIGYFSYGGGSVGIEESLDGVNPLATADVALTPLSGLANNSTFYPACRYFRVKVTGGTANSIFRVSVRRVG